MCLLCVCALVFQRKEIYCAFLDIWYKYKQTNTSQRGSGEKDVHPHCQKTMCLLLCTLSVSRIVLYCIKHHLILVL